MKKVWLIALWMALVAIPNLIFSQNIYDPRFSGDANIHLMAAISAGSLNRQCVKYCTEYFKKKCNKCLQKEELCIACKADKKNCEQSRKDYCHRCKLRGMENCRHCIEEQATCLMYDEGIRELLDEYGANINYLAGCWAGDTPLIETIKVDGYPRMRKRTGIAKKTGEEKEYRELDFDFRERSDKEKKADKKKREIVIRELLGRGADPSVTSCFFGVGPLMEVVKMRDLKVARWLLKAGANPNGNIHLRHEGFEDRCYRLDKTPLMEAARKGDLSMVKLLIESGANPFLYDKDGQTALRYADKNGRQEVKEYLQEQMIPN